MSTLTPAEIRGLESEAFKVRLAALDAAFSVAFEICTGIAREIKAMKENCPHRNFELRPKAKFCLDCGEYFSVDTRFEC